ncbi:MAG: SurA N-terminal domain-containing protein [Paracoccaceae bacterium]
MAKARSGISKFFFYLMLGFAVLAMAGFGLSGIFARSVSATAATVGEEKVTADQYFSAIQNELQTVSRRFGQQISIDQALQFGLDRTVLQRLISQAAHEGEVKRLEISVSDETVKAALLATPHFEGLLGGFDQDMYSDFLNRARLSPSEYETLLRSDSTQNILRASLRAGVVYPKAATDVIFKYIGESRDFTYARLNESSLKTPVPAPDDAALAAYYTANPEAFTQPLSRQITYISLTPEMVAEGLEISADRLEALYLERSEEYNTPAKRFIDRIVFGTMDEATEALIKIDSDAFTFDTLAVSRGLALTDIDLGEVGADDLNKATADLLFASDAPGVYGPVETDLGPALFRVNAAIAAQNIPLSEVTDALQQEIAIEDAGGIIADVSDEVIDLVAGGATLEEVANETMMQLNTIDLVEGTSEGIAAYSAFRDEATAAEIDEERDIIDLEDGGIFALRIEGITEAFVRPMDEVVQDVKTALIAEMTVTAVVARANQIKSALDASTNGTLEYFATNLQLQAVKDIARNANIADLPPSIIQQAFSAKIGDVVVVRDAEGAVIMRLSGITAFDPDAEGVADVLTQATQQQSDALTQDILGYFGAALVDAAAPTINQSILNSLHTQLQ